MVDTLDSKSGVSNDVPVRLRFAVPSIYKKDSFKRSLFVYLRVWGNAVKVISNLAMNMGSR